MLKSQESKFDAVDGKLVNRATGVAIPDDEPVFVLRAKDSRALQALWSYLNVCKDDYHRAAIRARIKQFTVFAANHPDRMQEPTTEEGLTSEDP